MRVQNRLVLTLLNSVIVLTLMMFADAFAACNQPDSPDCLCFDDTGAWNPAGAFIQDVAIQTVGTKESCACPGTFGCDWEIGPDDPFSNGGKPYYQMILGCNSEPAAQLMAWLISLPSWMAPDYEAREEWCSEAISYWHREAGIPYPGGYANHSWHLDWLNQNVGELKTWYMTEEDAGGRGRWIDPEDVDYDDYVLGVTVPVPGAYVAWRTFDDTNDTWVSDGGTHSLMINEMWIHKDGFGKAFKVEVTLLEGNSSNMVKDTRRWDDVLSLTPQGTEWIGTNKKIYGFGIDLDSHRQPIYDESRLHVVTWPFIMAPPARIVVARDPVWEQHYEPYLAALRAYAKIMQQAGEPNVASSYPALQISGIPDGLQTSWRFPKGLPPGLEVSIDLLNTHPLPILGMELTWNGGTLPRDFKVLYASPGQPFQTAKMPKIPDPSQLPSGLPLPVPAVFEGPTNGAQVRYVKLVFPSAFEQEATLLELRFRYYRGPLMDAEACGHELLGDLDRNCRVDFRDFALMAGNWLIDCGLTPEDPACRP